MESKRKTDVRRGRLLAFAASLAALLLLSAFGIWFSARQSIDHHSASSFPVRINEIIASNVRYGNPDGVFCDWVELYNGSDTDIDIGNYKLTDKSNEARYTFPPDTVISAGAYHIVYCMPAAANPSYADFGISSKGHETVILMNRRNALVDMVDTVALLDDQVMARGADGEWRVFDYATPGFENSEAGYAAYMATRMDTEGSACISEVISGNSFYYNADGVACDCVEVYNKTDAPLELAGYMLTDDIQDVRFTFGADVVLAPHGYLTVWCTRTPSERIGSEYYADFSISRGGGEEILLLNPHMQVIDRFLTVPTAKNTAMVRGADGSIALSAYATPGHVNTERGYAAYLAARQTEHGVLQISEYMAENLGYPDQSGKLSDWIELCNRGDAPLDVSGFGVSDRAGSVRHRLPDGTVIAPGGYLVVYCDSEATSANAAPFGLSADGGETLILTDLAGICVDAVLTIPTPANQSAMRSDDGTWRVESLATPGHANSESGREAYTANVNSDADALHISEWMSNNGATIADSRGMFSDWIELVNTGDVPIALSRYYLTDDANDQFQFRLPARTLEGGARALVFCSGMIVDGADEMHAPFRLSAASETVYLYSAHGTLVQSVTGASPGEDRSLVVSVDGTSQASAYPTPGYANDAAGYAACMENHPAPMDFSINEVAPSNRSYLRQNGGIYYDWVEIRNGTGEARSIGGYRLATDALDAGGCVLPDVMIAAGDSFLVLCSGDATLRVPEKNMCHAALSINAVEDRLFLFDPDGALVDYVRVFDVPPDKSIGRLPDQRGFYLPDKPSPGAANGLGTALAVPSAMPTSDTPGGVFNGISSMHVSLFADGDIYYTVDGSIPTAASPRYTEPIAVERTTVIRAISCEAGKGPSTPLTLSYIINENHELPVVSLVADPHDLFGTSGIYSNPLEDWERPASVAFFDGADGFSLDCGVRISGQTSRNRVHKSFKLLFEPKYGGKLTYDLYEDYSANTFSSLQLRSGLDAKYAVIREPFFTQLALPYKDTTICQNSRMAVVYLNGEYYGLYAIMEAYSEDFYADYFHVSPDSVTIIKGYLYDQSTEVAQLMKFAMQNDLRVEENYRYLDERIDMDSLIDWAIFEAYVHNGDLSGNIRYIKCSETGNKWQFALYDIECGISFSMNKNYASFDNLWGHGQTKMLLIPLSQNAEFRDKFLQRLAYHCRVTFKRENVLNVFEPLVAAVESEIPRNTERWGYGSRNFILNVERIRLRIEKFDRPMELITDVKHRFSMTDAEMEHYFGDLLHG